MFTIAEALILLGTDDEKGTANTSSSLDYGLSGAVLAELALEEKVELVDDKVTVIDDSLTDVSYFDTVIKEINDSKRKKKMDHWINHFANNKDAVKTPIYLSLVDKGILKEEEKTSLFIFTSNVYPTINEKPENQIRNHVNDVVFKGMSPDPKIAMLLSLIKACDLVNDVFGKENKKEANKRLDKIVENNEYGKLVSKSIEDIEAAILIATTTAITTTTIINN